MYTTRPTVLAGLKKGDNVSWYQFRDMYRPLIFHCARQCGIPASDFLELEQNVLVCFFNAVENFEYDPKKGRFRSYFGTLIHNCILQFRQEKKKKSVSLSGAVPRERCEDFFAKKWKQEWQQYCFWMAFERARAELPPREVEAFELCAIKKIAASTVASSLGISLSTVYEYKNRVLAALRDFVEEIRREEEAEI